jgi:hypothetical protein
VFANIHTAKLRFSGYSRAQRVEYRYWLGRFYLGKSQLTDAYKHLLWAFQNCLTSARKNKRAILQYLIAAGLPLGILPRQGLLDAYSLATVYSPLVSYLKKASYAEFMDHVDSTPWFYQHKLVVMLKARCMLVLHRRAIELLFKQKGRSVNLSFEDIQGALRQSMGPYWNPLAPTSDFIAIESVCISLIAQKLLFANIFVRNRVVRLKPDGAFPSLASVYHVTGSEVNVLSGREAWMIE